MLEFLTLLFKQTPNDSLGQYTYAGNRTGKMALCNHPRFIAALEQTRLECVEEELILHDSLVSSITSKCSNIVKFENRQRESAAAANQNAQLAAVPAFQLPSTPHMPRPPLVPPAASVAPNLTKVDFPGSTPPGLFPAPPLQASTSSVAQMD